MPREFKLPDVGEGVHEGELIEWLVDPGDAVSEDQPVAKVETDKALVDVPAPVNGTVRELRYEEGDVVLVGEVLLVFDVEGEVEEGALEADGESADAESSADVEPADAEGDEDGEPADASEEQERPSTPGGRVFAAPSARRLARELGVDVSEVDGSGPGGRVSEADVRAAAEGGSEPEPASADGAESLETEPATATGSSETGNSATGSQATSDSRTDAGGASGAVGSAPSESADRERTLAAPATRRIAEEEGVDLNAVPAAEERDGEAFVTPEAVREYAQVQQRAQEADAEAIAAGETEGTTEREEREPYRGMRKTIGDAMAQSKFTAPHVTHHDEVDVTELVETRERLKPRAEERGINLTYMPFVMKAVVAALKEYPTMNASLDEEAEEIVYKHYYNLGVATATDAGLMVPVVDDVDEKGLLQIASEMNELVQKARDRTISPDELRGSTFTITNVGGIGGEYATPIVNYPEVGILALGEIKRKPRVVVRDEETGEVRPSRARPGSGDEQRESAGESIEPRDVLTLSLSFDHRLVDGAIGARFTNAVMERLENPELLLLE